MLVSPFRFVPIFAFLTVALATSPRADAQPTRREPTPNDSLKSTEVSTDNKVTFRIYAPKAGEVSVSGDFGAGGKLTKDEKGVWSITVGPFTPDFYSYTFYGRRCPDDRSQECHDQAGDRQPGEHVSVAGRRG